jgi:hypothetical protein
MEHLIPLPSLPTAAELPDSDDNELQNLVPKLLLAILSDIIVGSTTTFYVGLILLAIQ